VSGPGDGPPSGYGPPGYGPPTNPMAIAALVLALTVAPVGLALGIAARRQIRRTGEQGDGLALAAIIIGGIATGIWVLLVALLVISWFVLVGSVSLPPDPPSLL
jgi:Domain of unknown function (DUF4190)